MTQWQESTFTTFDGLELFYCYRPPKQPTQSTLLILHRGHEHSGRMMLAADALSEGDYGCFSFDLRGHGLSEGPRAWAADFNTWVKDLNSFAGHLQQQFDIQTQDIIIVANSVSSVIALTWILNYGADVKGCILAAPAFSIKLYIPLALPALRLVSRVSSHQFVTSYVKPAMLTRDEQAAKAYADDPLITKKIGVNVLVTLFEASKNCFKRLADFETPVLLLTAGNDHIVHNTFHHKFIAGIASKNKQHIILDDFRHALFFEQQQYKVINPCKSFIDSLFEVKEKHLPAIIPNARQHTQRDYDALLKPGSRLKQFYYATFRALLTRFGRHSDGIALGLAKGFDSGVTLDYVYRNTPAGSNAFGRLIDRIYLNSAGWRGIRTRKKHLTESLKQLTTQLDDEGQMPIIFDVAAGAGRYLFELQQQAPFAIELHLNDIDQNSIAQAKIIATEFGADNTTFINQDVFTLKATPDLSRQPNIIVISGLFELYDNNKQVHQVIAALFSMLQQGGYLIYTGQPWHPQIELIGRLLNNRQGKRWVMRRRIQAEMDQLVTSAGFEKLNTTSDELGIFTVSCAKKTTVDISNKTIMENE